MRILILTSRRRSLASRCLPTLCNNRNIQIVKVILSHDVSPSKMRWLNRRIKKTLHIGLLGALNGIRVRDWYVDEEAADIYTV